MDGEFEAFEGYRIAILEDEIYKGCFHRISDSSIGRWSWNERVAASPMTSASRASCAVTAGAAIRAFGVAHAIPLIYAVCGMVLNVALGWNTSLACGVTGLLWALGPLMASLRELSGGKSWLAVTLSTLTGGLLLFAWASLGLGT